ncbi:hypothetical protein Taro_050075 [Colocasia esculenta]|uniref:Uncharacterized protein n=1 Tax=Colocasia esculenta TaxID=4460 RepID=A0A843XD21_COLES|nr:hypothetical protein [Colocasia esculenta]
MALVSSALTPVELEERVVLVVDVLFTWVVRSVHMVCVCVASSTTSTVVTSSVGSPRPAGWAQSTHRFAIYERDRAWHRVLNATALGVAFWLPPQSGLCLHVRCVSRTGWPADVEHGKATTFFVAFLCGVVGLHCSLALLCGYGAAVGPFVRDCETERLGPKHSQVLYLRTRQSLASRFERDGSECRILVAAVKRSSSACPPRLGRPNRAPVSSVRPEGGGFAGFLGDLASWVIFGVVSLVCVGDPVMGTRIKVPACEGEGPFCRVLNVTVRPVAALAPVTLEERVVHMVNMVFTWFERCVCGSFVVVGQELGPESLKVPGMDLQLCGLQMWCWLVSTVLWLYYVVVERQLDLSSVTTRQRGLPDVVCLGGSTILVVVSWWYLVEVGAGMRWTGLLIPVQLPFVGRLPVKIVA